MKVEGRRRRTIWEIVDKGSVDFEFHEMVLRKQTCATQENRVFHSYDFEANFCPNLIPNFG
jgi:hypothetical protein